jgi:hypothetical protein
MIKAISTFTAAAVFATFAGVFAQTPVPGPETAAPLTGVAPASVPETPKATEEKGIKEEGKVKGKARGKRKVKGHAKRRGHDRADDAASRHGDN